MARLTTIQAFTSNLATRSTRRVVFLRNPAAALQWMNVIALLGLLSLVASDYFVPTNFAEFAAHIVEEGDHYSEHCAPEFPLIDPPTINDFAEPGLAFLLPGDPGVVVRGVWPNTRDRPPPLFASLCHSLRAPPTLIPA